MTNPIEFGDFQTPDNFAIESVRFLHKREVKFREAIEPTCGSGSFMEALARTYSHNFSLRGYELNPSHVESARRRMAEVAPFATVQELDFFKADWQSILKDSSEPLLLFGNPPWVTNSVQGSSGFTNLPEKTNFQNMKGFDAISGKSNFDISEWILIKLIESAGKKSCSLAFLVKTSVARKILMFSQKNGIPVRDAAIVSLDSKSVFGVSVDACLFFMSWDAGSPVPISAKVYSSFSDEHPKTIGFAGDRLMEDASESFSDHPMLAEPPQKWRSGIKHDCSKVMELRLKDGSLYNGFGELVEVEDDHFFPILKGSDIANGRLVSSRAVIVTQRKVGQPTDHLSGSAPKLWRYLQNKGEYLSQRKSSIYKGKPEFSIFGVGDYSFAPYKIAISGLYKSINFRLLGPQNGKPVLVDDTVYTISFDNLAEAQEALALLESEQYQKLLSASVFWDEKRPIKASILNSITWIPVLASTNS